MQRLCLKTEPSEFFHQGPIPFDIKPTFFSIAFKCPCDINLHVKKLNWILYKINDIKLPSRRNIWASLKLEPVKYPQWYWASWQDALTHAQLSAFMGTLLVHLYSSTVPSEHICSLSLMPIYILYILPVFPVLCNMFDSLSSMYHIKCFTLFKFLLK